jgi:2-oxoglutarate ferredoxin oxidoreductase subunit alpha
MESNYTAQMGGLIKEKTGIEIKDNYLKFDGRPFFVEEIVEKLKSVTKG